MFIDYKYGYPSPRKFCCKTFEWAMREKDISQGGYFMPKLQKIYYIPRLRLYCFEKGDLLLDPEILLYCPYCGKKLPLPLNNTIWTEVIKKELGANYLPKYDEYRKEQISLGANSKNWPKGKQLPKEFWNENWWKKRHYLDNEISLKLWKKKYNTWERYQMLKIKKGKQVLFT